MKDKKVLLAGATGYLGGYVANQLLEEGYYSRFLVRDAKKIKLEPGNYDIAEAQVTQKESMKALFDDMDVVISTIGITKQKDGLTYMDVDYGANMNLLELAKKSGVKKFIYVSAFGADTLTHLKICYAKELFVKELEKSGMDYCIIRPNGFFSDSAEFFKMAEKGKAYLFGKGKYKLNPIHGADLARICTQAIEADETDIEVGGPEVLTQNEIINLAFDIVGKVPRITYIPDWFRRFLLWLLRTFTSSKMYGPFEFFMTVLAMDMVAPKYGSHRLEDFFRELSLKNKSL